MTTTRYKSYPKENAEVYVEQTWEHYGSSRAVITSTMRRYEWQHKIKVLSLLHDVRWSMYGTFWRMADSNDIYCRGLRWPSNNPRSAENADLPDGKCLEDLMFELDNIPMGWTNYSAPRYFRILEGGRVIGIPAEIVETMRAL